MLNQKKSIHAILSDLIHESDKSLTAAALRPIEINL